MTPTAPPTADHCNELGKVAWLWMNSPLHRRWPIDLLTRFALPPIVLGQYLVIERDGLPVAYCSWAHLSQQSEADYLADASGLPLADWNGGDRLWLIDWIAPFSKTDSWDMRTRLGRMFPTSVARALRVRRDSSKARVMEFKGASISREAAAQVLTQYAEDFLRVITERSTAHAAMTTATATATATEQHSTEAA